MDIVIQASGAERQEILHDAKHERVKFVLISDGLITQAHLFGTHTQHSHYAERVLDAAPAFRLIGAGFIGREIPEWGSGSCMEDYGYDRPLRQEDASNILSLLRSAVFSVM